MDSKGLVKPARFLSLLLPALLLFVGCPQAPEERVTAATWFPLRIGEREIEAQLAVTPEEMQTGLMHRGTLDPDSGMIFVHASPRRQSFWMMNTLLPLDIGFFTADGILREVRGMRPNDLTPVPSSRSDIQFAIEMNGGWFEKNGVRPGAALRLDDLARALRRRGFDPEQFNFPVER